MTSEFFRLAEPMRLTVAQLKQGITLYEGNLQQGSKKEFAVEFERARETYFEKQRTEIGLNAFVDNPKTRDLMLSRHENDLTQGAFQITGVLQNPVQNAKIAEQLREERATMNVQTSPPKKLKANIEFERTPQTVIQDPPPTFGASHYAPEEPGVKTSQFAFSAALEENAKLVATHLGGLEERSQGIVDDIEVSKLRETVARTAEQLRSTRTEESVPHVDSTNPQGSQGRQESVHSSRSASQSPPPKNPKDDATVSPQSPSGQSFHSSLQVSDLGSTRTAMSVSKPSRPVRYGVQKSANKPTRLTISIAVGLLLAIIGSVCAADAKKSKQTIPGLSALCGVLGRALLPKNLVQESAKYSLKPQAECPSHALCDEKNQVVGCEKTYVLQNQPKQRASSNFYQRAHNKAVMANAALHKAAGKALPSDNFTKEYLRSNQPLEYFVTRQCARVTKDQQKYTAFLQDLEHAFLVAEGQRRCALIRAAMRTTKLSHLVDVDEVMAMQPEPIEASYLAIFTQKQHIADAILHLLATQPEEIKLYAPQSMHLQASERGATVSSAAEPILSLACKSFVLYQRSRGTMLQFMSLMLFLATCVVSLAVTVKVNKIVQMATIQAKQHLKNVAQHERGGDQCSSCINYAVRGDLLQQLTVGEYCFQKQLWKRVERKLAADCQIEKHWTRTKQGKVVEAYYFNGDGLIAVKKAASTRDDESEHSLSY